MKEETLKELVAVTRTIGAYLISGCSIWPNSGVHKEVSRVIEKINNEEAEGIPEGNPGEADK